MLLAKLCITCSRELSHSRPEQPNFRCDFAQAQTAAAKLPDEFAEGHFVGVTPE
jgi:hypothetical protein